MDKDRKQTKPDRNFDPDTAKKPAEATAKQDPKKNKSHKAEHLPLGTGYQVKELPTEVIRVEVSLTEEIIPDLFMEAEILEKFDAPIPAPEDDFYDFEKDIYGDSTEFQP